MKKVIITGSTGMVGKLVLQNCIASEQIEQIITINRKRSGLLHPKITEVVHTDFLNYDEIEKWKDFGGIRNEEDYLITETGKQLLGKKKPMSIDEVEALRAY